jgi:hypothetical protein
MRKYIISYASKGYYSLQDRFENSVKNTDCKVISYSDRWLKFQAFYKENSEIFKNLRGGGFWLWKPFIIKDILSKMNYGDILFYSDVDAIFLDNINILFDICDKNEILLFKNSNQINAKWTKRDCFVLMGADDKQYHYAPQVNAAFLTVKKTIFTEKLIDEWIHFSCDYRILTDCENEMGYNNLEEFIEHRHDQSILGILACRWNIELYRDPTEFGNMYKKNEYRVMNEYLEHGDYSENLVLSNSNYGTLLSFDGDNLQMKKFRNNIIYKTIRFVKHVLLVLF